MTVSLYQSGVSGLLAAQQQLATTGHNISNVNTEGYNRQRADQNAAIGLNDGSNYVGGGTYIQDITRLYDQFSHKEQVLTQSKLGSAESLNARLTQLDQIMATSGNSVVGSLQQFYQSMNGVADNPNDAGLRSIVLNQASTVSTDFNELSSNFEQMTKSINGEIEQVVNKISEISIEVAKLNDAIMQTQSSNTGKPNDLLDKRDQLIGELSGYTRVTTVEDTNGVLTVMIGQGTTLVAGITPLTIQVGAGSSDPQKTELRLSSGSNSVSLQPESLGGSLGASFEFRDEHLAQTRKEIDRLAMAFSATLNESQASGLDLNGLQGANFFNDINSAQLQQGRVLAPATNTGSTQAQVTINDVSKLTTDEFEIRFEAGTFTLYNLTNGSSENLGAAGSGTPAGTHTPSSPDYGFSFVETGTPVNGDTFTIVPTKNSAALMAVTMTNGNAIAASSAIAVTPSTNNVSDGSIEITNVLDPETANAYDLTVDVYQSATVPVTFEYRVYNTATPPPAATLATGTYGSGGSAVVDIGSPVDLQIEIKGDLVGLGADARESFSLGGAFGVGNGTNAVAMAKTQEQSVVNGGKQTFNQSLATSTSVVGSKASNAELTVETAQALFTQAYNRNQSTSGVNLDEEAANLLKYQQAYQAASQIISTANTIFDTILSAVR